MKIVKISDIFTIKYGNSFELVNMNELESIGEDSVNFISRTEKNNWISAFVEKTDVEPFPWWTITVAVWGSVLSTFLQRRPYYTWFHVMVLFPKRKMSDIELLFYCHCIRQNKYRYNYWRQANKTLKDIEIPDLMPEERRDLSIEKLNTLNNNAILKTGCDLSHNMWSEFKISDIFDITWSKTTPITELNENCGVWNYPFVTTQATNNWIEGFYDSWTEEWWVLTIDSAVLWYCSYQPLNFSASDHVEKLIPKFDMDKYIAMFLVTIINKEQYRYNYWRKASQTRLRERSIKLPSTVEHMPDRDFMRNYIKSLSYSVSL